MARTQDQQRWRSNTCRKRIEVYLPPDVVNRLDALATERGQKRPAVIAALIDSAAPAAEAAPEPAADTVAETNAPPPSEIQAIEASTHSDPKGYKTRRPRSADEKRYDWIVAPTMASALGSGLTRPDSGDGVVGTLTVRYSHEKPRVILGMKLRRG